MIYVDNAATSDILPEVINEMMPFLKTNYGNASSIYSFARNSRNAIENARKTIANCINADTDEIFFTSGGSESDNWAIKQASSAIFFQDGTKNNIVISEIEHHAVIHSAKFMKNKYSFLNTLIKVDSNGLINFNDFNGIIANKNIAMVSVMMVNNEIGTIQPIKEIADICKDEKIIFHTDAVQAAGHIDVDVKKLGCDMLSISAHKFGGPKGIGILFIKKRTPIFPLIEGGAQEKNMRAGTENVAAIVGMATALEISCKRIEQESARLINLQKKIIKEFSKIPRSRLNGHPELRLPGNINFSFEGVEGEGIILNLDNLGICASTGSACTSSSLEASHVLLAIGLSHEIAHGSLRLTLGPNNTEDEIDFIIEKVPKVIEKLRQMSPIWHC